MSSKPPPKRPKKTDDDLQIRQMIKERSEMNEGLNRLLEKIKNDKKNNS
jgi:hypothetical protein